MAFSVVMPALEIAQETGKLIAWRKNEGDPVTKGEPLLEIETDKAVMEVEAPADGVLAGITGKVGSDIPVGQTIAWIVAPGEKPPAENKSPTPAARGTTESYAAPVAMSAAEPSSVVQSASARISPKARRLAEELGVDIATVRGTGPGGEILASDVQAAPAAPVAPTQTEAKSTNLEVPSTLGRLMAERTTQSWSTVPHFFVTREIEAVALNQYRDKLAAEIERLHNIHITHTDVLVALTARVLLKHPRLNSSWTVDGIRLHDHVNMGVAVAVNDGVVAAVIPNAHTARLPEISQQRRDIVERARAGKLRPADIAGATFTISNLGMYHVDQFSAIINPPQAAILAVGTIADRVVAVEGKPTVRLTITLTLSCDHRAADGARAAMFLNDLADAVLHPQKCLA
jgi:pyruvate dehydrogenase E2 component (dihydrolipoamide acetyltransferase)